MAIIYSGYLEAIATENQRLVDVAKSLLSLTSQANDPSVSSHMQYQVNALLDIAGRISEALANAR
jgi:hypothetical protein